MKRIWKAIVATTAAVAVVALGACSSGGSGGGASPSVDGKKVRVGATLLTQSHPFYVKIKESMEAKAKELGVELLISVADQDLNKQVAQVEDFINKQVDAVIVSPVDSDGVTGAIKKAQQADIPVITIDIPANNVEVDSHVATDNLAGGKIAAEAMAQFLNGKGQVGLITYPEVQSVRDRIDGFKAGTAKYPDMKIVKETPGRDRQAAKAASEDMLTSVPTLAGIFGFGDDMALAATQAVSDANSKAVVIGFDGMDEALKSVDADNAFQAVVVQYPDKMGEAALTNAIDLVQGKQVPKVTPITPGLYVHGKGEVPVKVDGDTITLSVK